jgi:hypothetical protein
LQKITIILCMVVYISGGCSVFNQSKKTDTGLYEKDGIKNILEDVEFNNITTNSFFIQKAEVIISEGEEKHTIITSVKYNKPDKYLFSIKAITGIEIARIYMSKDTILINDRINRMLLFGDPEDAEKKFGISILFLKMIFGDLFIDNIESDNGINCKNGKADINTIYKGKKIFIVIDCKRNKTIYASIVGNSQSDKIEMWYKGFVHAGNKYITERIDIEDAKGERKIRIMIKRIEIPWSGNLEFIPGKEYEVKGIL